MKKSHTGLWIAAVYLFVAAIYSVLLFILKPSLDLSAWVLYGFTLVAFGLIAAMSGMSTGRMAFLQIPHAAVSGVYFFVQFIFGGIVMMAQDGLPLTPVVAGEIIWTALYLVFTFATGIVRGHASAQEFGDQRGVQDDRQLIAQLQSMSVRLSEGDLKRQIDKAAESLRYAFPVGTAALKPLQEEIRRTVSIIEDAVADHDEETALKYAQKLISLIEERKIKSRLS